MVLRKSTQYTTLHHIVNTTNDTVHVHNNVITNDYQRVNNDRHKMILECIEQVGLSRYEQVDSWSVGLIITHIDIVDGVRRLSAVRVCVCMCVCQHSKTTGHTITNLGR